MHLRIVAGIVVAGVHLGTTGLSAATTAPRATGKIAFTRVTTQSPYVSHIVMMNADGSDQRDLTSGNVRDYGPAWSPDGKRIAFTRWRDSKGIDVYVVDADGGGLRRLTRTRAADAAPSWSPDGRTIAFVRNGFLKSRRVGGGRKANGTYLMNADGSRARRLTRLAGAGFESPAWSPDGRTLAISAGVGEIWLINRDGSGQRLLAKGEFTWPSWSPDGRKLAFVTMPGGYDSIYVINADGSGLRRLTRHAYTESGFAWTPDGRRIVYARERSGGVSSIAVEGSGDRLLTRNPMRRDLTPGGFAWSPNGRSIAYASELSGHGDIYVMRANGAGQQQLTAGPEIDGDPDWSPGP